MNAFPELFLANGIVTNRIRFSHLRVTSGEWARGSRTTLTRKINDTLPRLPHHVFQCRLLSGLLNGPVTGAWAEKRATMPSHRAGFGVSTAGFLSLQENPPQRRFASKNSGAQLASVPTPRRDRATRRERNDRAPSPVRELFFERRPAHRVGGASRVSVPRSMLGWLLGGRATKEERRTAAIRCATRDSALKQCVVANSKETCDRLAQDLDLCKVRLVGNVRCRYRTRARARARPTRASRRRRRVAPRACRLLAPHHFKKARDLVTCAISSRQHDRLNSLCFPHAIPQGRVVCPDAAAEFSRCAHLVVNHTGKQADVPDCSRQLRKMRACLRRKRV